VEEIIIVHVNICKRNTERMEGLVDVRNSGEDEGG